MYLSKQWRESRAISVIALLGLILLLIGIVKATLKIDSVQMNGNDPQAYPMMFVALFYMESAFIAFWAWLIASIGAGKNLGEESGSFLFTRPRPRAWFLWNDWGYAMAQIALIILLANVIMGCFLEHIHTLMRLPAGVQLTAHTDSMPLVLVMLLISFGVLLFAGLVYSVTYFSTLVLKRAMGVVLGAGILVGYAALRGIIGHYYPSIRLPNLTMDLFNFNHHSFSGLSGHLGVSFAARAVLILLFPLAAQVILDRAEI